MKYLFSSDKKWQKYLFLTQQLISKLSEKGDIKLEKLSQIIYDYIFQYDILFMSIYLTWPLKYWHCNQFSTSFMTFNEKLFKYRTLKYWYKIMSHCINGENVKNHARFSYDYLDIVYFSIDILSRNCVSQIYFDFLFIIANWTHHSKSLYSQKYEFRAKYHSKIKFSLLLWRLLFSKNLKNE